MTENGFKEERAAMCKNKKLNEYGQRHDPEKEKEKAEKEKVVSEPRPPSLHEIVGNDVLKVISGRGLDVEGAVWVLQRVIEKVKNDTLV